MFKFITKLFMSDKNTSTGYRSTGDFSTGDRSTGNFSTGDRSTGDFSTGDFSTGYRSTGHRSTGHRSTGDFSTGDRSTGNFSTGDRSTGDFSTGYRSTGDFSTGNCSISNYSSGHFSTIDFDGYGWFDKPCKKLWSEVDTPDFFGFRIAYWIEEEKMTQEEKDDNSTYKTTGGFLKKVDYKTAWAIFWRNTDEENKQKFLNLPNFDAEVFKKITGINVNKKNVEISMGEVAEKFGVDVNNLKIKK